LGKIEGPRASNHKVNRAVTPKKEPEMHDLGIDIAKETLDVTLLKAGESKEHHQHVANNPSGHQKLIEWLDGQVEDRSQVRAVMEATNIYWEELAETLHAQGLKVSVVNPAAIKGFAQSQIERTKTDKQDSRVIAAFARKTQPPTWQPPSPEQRKLRALVRHKQALLKTRTQQRNRLASCHDDDVQASLQTVIAVLDSQVADLEAKIAALIEADDQLHTQHQLITSIKGIGSATASLILAEFYDLNRYPSAKAVAADAGITPAHHQSGTSVHRKPTMSRIGKATVRAALFWPAQTAIRFNPIVAALADRLKQRGKPFGVILVAAMRKLLHLVFGVVKNQTPFDPNFSALASLSLT
jgi:transposase